MKMKITDQLLAALTLSPVEKYILEKFVLGNFYIIASPEMMKEFIEMVSARDSRDAEKVIQENLQQKFEEFMNSKKRGEKRLYLVTIDSSAPAQTNWGGCKVHSLILKYKDGKVEEKREQVIEYLYHDGRQ